MKKTQQCEACTENYKVADSDSHYPEIYCCLDCEQTSQDRISSLSSDKELVTDHDFTCNY